MNNCNNKKKGLVDLLVRKTTLPCDTLAGEFRLEVRGRGLLFMQGCRRILKYSPEEMILAAKEFEVYIEGRNLICSTYHDGTVTVEGAILSLKLGEE